nr:immunoglobulin heavy chain junction region [Macaca mulatta]MOW77777.1 immunoglobulin heavy chain junction region [Macaca mulatta]MOW79316.1 immunoglobulin heavy chain junction region [Macaca mulatta]MOW80509.1 immunoglobulin heavy chain junction region [Macaca mulatta]MOW83239.1 immunoglobulin heavy chain junction region [Macaca mulatta]
CARVKGGAYGRLDYW